MNGVADGLEYPIVKFMIGRMFIIINYRPSSDHLSIAFAV